MHTYRVSRGLAGLWPQTTCLTCRPCSRPTPELAGSHLQQQQEAPGLEACASVAARGVTFSAASGDLTLPWLAQMGDFLAVAYSVELLEAAPPPAPLSVSVHLRVRESTARASCRSWMLDVWGVPALIAALHLQHIFRRRLLDDVPPKENC